MALYCIYKYVFSIVKDPSAQSRRWPWKKVTFKSVCTRSTRVLRIETFWRSTIKICDICVLILENNSRRCKTRTNYGGSFIFYDFWAEYLNLRAFVRDGRSQKTTTYLYHIFHRVKYLSDYVRGECRRRRRRRVPRERRRWNARL